jgi:hypothetical protein
VINPAGLLAAIPKALSDALIKTYQEIASNYLERRWEPSELNGGKFCEAVYSIVQGAVTGSFPLTASKPSDMVTACRAIEKLPADPQRLGDRSLRLLIPRALPVLYEIRNNRGVGHVGGDVDANHMDAEAVRGMASWIMAELVRIFHGVTTEEAQEAVDALVERKCPMIWEIGPVKRVLDVSLITRDQVLVLLHYSTGWVSAIDLYKWTEYSNASAFRGKVLTVLHDDRLVEFDRNKDVVRISPRGIEAVEDKLRKQT